MYCEIKGSIMEIGERIRLFSILRGMTRKHIGIQVFFLKDFRYWYEAGSRKPKLI